MAIDTQALKGRDFISLHDFTAGEVRVLLDTARELKSLCKQGVPTPVLQGRTLATVFHKPSLRTRVSFEVGMTQLGGHAMHMTADEMGFGKRESIADIARVLASMVDGIMIRTFSHEWVLQLSEHSRVPVINGLDDLLHPTQALADVMTVEEKLGTCSGVKLAYVGDGNNVAHSLMFAAPKVGMNLVLGCPAGHRPDKAIWEAAKADAGAAGTSITLADSPEAAVDGADVIYTDVWTSMGQEAFAAERLADFRGWQVNMELVRLAKPGALIMHCLPAHRGEEITDEAMDCAQSVVFDQAENRLHAHKGILACLL